MFYGFRLDGELYQTDGIQAFWTPESNAKGQNNTLTSRCWIEIYGEQKERALSEFFKLMASRVLKSD
jgi:hypothetical protein